MSSKTFAKFLKTVVDADPSQPVSFETLGYTITNLSEIDHIKSLIGQRKALEGRPLMMLSCHTGVCGGFTDQLASRVSDLFPSVHGPDGSAMPVQRQDGSWGLYVFGSQQMRRSIAATP